MCCLCYGAFDGTASRSALLLLLLLLLLHEHLFYDRLRLDSTNWLLSSSSHVSPQCRRHRNSVDVVVVVHQPNGIRKGNNATEENKNKDRRRSVGLQRRAHVTGRFSAFSSYLLYAYAQSDVLQQLAELYSKRAAWDSTCSTNWPPTKSILGVYDSCNNAYGLTCSRDGKGIDIVTSIDLSSCNIKTTLSGKLFEAMTATTSVDLSNNKIDGTLEGTLGGPLQVLKLNSNLLVGPLPTEWSTCTTLQYLDVSNNKLVGGTLPEVWADLSSLKELYISSSGVKGSLPDPWGKMPALQKLDLSSNKLEGPLPPQWAQPGFPALQLLSLNNNALSDLWHNVNFTFLTKLELQNNKLSGPLPPVATQIQF